MGSEKAFHQSASAAVDPLWGRGASQASGNSTATGTRNGALAQAANRMKGLMVSDMHQVCRLKGLAVFIPVSCRTDRRSFVMA
jgi:hypothetical protein